MDCDVTSFHVDSYNYLYEEGLNLAAQAVPVEKFQLATGEPIELSFTHASLGKPVLDGDVGYNFIIVL